MGIDHTDPDVLVKLHRDEGLTLTEIAERAGVAQSTVSYHFDKHEIDNKTTGEVIKERHRSRPAYYRTDARGYERWYVQQNGRQRCVGVSRLLAVCEHGLDSLDGSHVHHKNGLCWDNRPENIEVVDEGEHISMHNRGEKAHLSKLTESEVKKIEKALDNTDQSLNELANRFDVSDSAISDIKFGRTWGHVESSETP